MSQLQTNPREVFSALEIARAAGVSVDMVRRLADGGDLTSADGRFFPAEEAIRAVKFFRGVQTAAGDRPAIHPLVPTKQSPLRGLAASGALHAGLIGMLALLTSWGVSSSAVEPPPSTPARLVFLATPGPGGGGGGGGLRQPAPPPQAEMKGESPLRSPVPRPRPIASKRAAPEPRRITPPARPIPAARPLDPPPAPVVPDQMPQVVAPVATEAADAENRPGVLAPAPASTSSGPGSGGGVGSGQGTGIGEGDGSGIGPGSGGGTGGGPYRPGSGITPPAIMREVKPDYTEDARRRGVEGDVVLEIIVRRDGTVGSITLLQGLGAGLDQRAIDAVRQWRFSPAHRYGSPVDVVVEVAVEFKLR